MAETIGFKFTSSDGTRVLEKITDTGITLNGDTNLKVATIYAPRSAGSSGQVLIGNDRGAPIWTSTPTLSGEVTAASFNATSDRRAKENIRTSEVNAGEILSDINVVEYNYISDEEKKNTIGCIAQELRDILPDNLKTIIRGEETEDSYLSINNDQLTYLLIKAYQEEKQKRVEIEERLAAIEAKLK